MAESGGVREWDRPAMEMWRSWAREVGVRVVEVVDEAVGGEEVVGSV